jgi:hypothetical protein
MSYVKWLIDEVCVHLTFLSVLRLYSIKSCVYAVLVFDICVYHSDTSI